ncbi:MAG: beta-lactamase family protein [Rivularia sp. (in: Bacteria)]|nr:beta-lactamase family protein [Rivularia sp. MS3]
MKLVTKLIFFISFTSLSLSTTVSARPVLQSNSIRTNPVPKHEGLCHTSIDAAIDKLVEDAIAKHKIPGLTVSVSKDGRMVCDKGYGYANWKKKTPMTPRSRSQIGSVSKVIVAAGMMKLVEQGAVSLQTPIYGENGILKGAAYQKAMRQGTRRHRPIIDMAVGKNNRVFTWYVDGKVTEGSSEDLDKHSQPKTFTVPPGQSFNSIVAIARGGKQNRVYTWYDNGSYSVGTPTDLAAFKYRKQKKGQFKGYKIPNNNQRDNIVGIGMDTNKEITYTWYHDGTVSSGSITNLKSRWIKKYTVPGNTSRRYNIVGTAVSGNNVKLAWYSDKKASKGSATNLSSIKGLYDYQRRNIQGSISSWLNEYNNVQVRHLLSHTSGFTRSGKIEQAAIKYNKSFDKYTNPLPYRLSHLYVLSTRKRLFTPGSRYKYSNHGLGLVGFLIQQISGDSYDVFLKNNILNPIGLGKVIPKGTVIDENLDANPHGWSKGKIVTKKIHPTNHPGSAAGSLKATAGDLVRFMLATDKLPNHSDILKPETIDLMESRLFPNTAPRVAHGWHINCQDSACNQSKLAHNGKTGGGTAYMTKFKNYELDNIDVSGINIAIATNFGKSSNLRKLADDIARKLGAVNIPQNYDLLNSET